MVRRLRNESSKPADKWMNVALNVKCRQVSRTGVESPYSLFLNRKGFSYCTVNKQMYRVETDTFLLTQPGDIYDLVIDNTGQTEICNIHINREFFNNALYAISTTSPQLLNNPENKDYEHPLFTQLQTKDDTINRLVTRIVNQQPADANEFELILIEIINHLALSNDRIKASINTLPFLKASVRQDIYKRLSSARDHIYSTYDTSTDLDEICREAGMSKFHFLRMFKSLYGITPYQYFTDVRMKKAAELLKTSQLSVNEIAAHVGFEYPNSLIKAFQKTYGQAPLQYRHGQSRANSNIG